MDRRESKQRRIDRNIEQQERLDRCAKLEVEVLKLRAKAKELAKFENMTHRYFYAAFLAGRTYNNYDLWKKQYLNGQLD